jgi:uncharacterized protein
MLLLDVNVLVQAHRADLPRHERIAGFVSRVLSDGETVLIPDLTLTGFVRIVTNPRIFRPPTSLDVAFLACETLLSRATRVSGLSLEGWAKFVQLSKGTSAEGDLIPDAYLGIGHRTGGDPYLDGPGFLPLPGAGMARPAGLGELDRHAG